MTKKPDLIKLFKANWKPALAVTLINIPLSISLAVASLGPDSTNAPLVGLLTAIYAGIFASLFASSKHNIYGPAGALSGILLAFVLAGTGNIFLIPVVTILSGIIILLVSVFKITKYITLIPTSALHGFLIGVGIIIALSQLNAALGITPLESHSHLFNNVMQTYSQISEINNGSFILFLLSFGFLLTFKRFITSIPGAVPLTAIGILAGWIFAMFPDSAVSSIEILKTKFPSLSFSLADFSYLSEAGSKLTDITTIKIVIRYALVIAVIAILETIIAAKIAEKATKMSFEKDKEIFGLGLSNLAVGAVGGMPATAVLVRTAFNVKSGATSKMSAFLVAIFTLTISVLLFDVFTYLPMPVIAAILMNIAIGLIDIKVMRELKHLDKVSYITALIVAFITLVEDPIIGIIVGTILALMLFVRRVSKGRLDVTIFRSGKFYDKMGLSKYLPKQDENDSIIVRFPGTINYINAESFVLQIKELKKPKHMVFSFGQVVNVDIDGIEIIDDLIQSFIDKGVDVYITGVCSDEMIDIFKKTDKLYSELKKQGKVYKSSAFVLDELKLGVGN